MKKIKFGQKKIIQYFQNDMRSTYTLLCVHNAISLLRPGALYALSNTEFIGWNDPRPVPTWEEISETLKKLKEFEDSIECIELTEEDQYGIKVLQIKFNGTQYN